MKNYYFVLGLNIYARDAEIKRAYRQLALRYHPDRNSSAEAEPIFKEINEAYEVLSDPSRKLLYDQMLVGVDAKTSPPPTPHRDPRYRPKPPGFVHPRNSRHQRLFDFMNSNLRYAIIVSRLTLFFSVILIVDYSSKPTKSIQRIIEMENRYGGSISSVKVQMDNGNSLTLAGKDASKFEMDKVIALYSSPLLAVPVKIEDESSNIAAGVPVSIYGNFIFVPLVLLLTSLIGAFYWKGVEFRFNLGVMNLLLLFFTFIFLRIHNF